MNDTSKPPAGAAGTATSAGGAAWPDLGLAQAEWVRLALLSIEANRSMLDFQRTMLDLSREMLRRQQDAAFEAMRSGLRSGTASPWPSPGEAGGADLMRLGMQAFERMAAAMRGLAPVPGGADAAPPEPSQRGAVSRRAR